MQSFASAKVLMRSQWFAALGDEVVVGIDEESTVISLSNFRFVMFFLLRSPKFCVALASQVIQHARQDHFRFSGLEATFHRGFDPVLLYDLGRNRV
jgi:hypothetical protein